MRAATKVQSADWRPRLLVGLGAAILMTAALLLPIGAFAKVESQPKPSRSANPADPPAETGGNPILSPGPFQLACLQNGLKVIEGRRVDRIAVPPSSLIGALSFRRAGDRGQSIILPLGDGLTTCVLSQEPEYLQRATAAFERAIVTNSVTTWASARVEARGKVVPLRSFADGSGRTCREFTQSVTVAGRLETGTGVACRQGRGSWRLIE